MNKFKNKDRVTVIKPSLLTYGEHGTVDSEPYDEYVMVRFIDGTVKRYHENNLELVIRANRPAPVEKRPLPVVLVCYDDEESCKLVAKERLNIRDERDVYRLLFVNDYKELDDHDTTTDLVDEYGAVLYYLPLEHRCVIFAQKITSETIDL